MPTCDIAIIIVCAGRHGTTERRAGAPGMNTKYEKEMKLFYGRYAAEQYKCLKQEKSQKQLLLCRAKSNARSNKSYKGGICRNEKKRRTFSRYSDYCNSHSN